MASGKKLDAALFTSAYERGVRPVRRKLHSDSWDKLNEVTEKLIEIIGDDNDGGIFKTSTLSTTIIGMSRFNARHMQKSPPTMEVIENIPSIHRSVPAEIGNLALFGSDRGRRKLGFKLDSPDIRGEARGIERAFSRRGFTLRDDPNAIGTGFVPHLTIGYLFRSAVPAYEACESCKLEQLDRSLGVLGSTVILKAVNLVTQTQQADKI